MGFLINITIWRHGRLKIIINKNGRAGKLEDKISVCKN